MTGGPRILHLNYCLSFLHVKGQFELMSLGMPDNTREEDTGTNQCHQGPISGKHPATITRKPDMKIKIMFQKNCHS